MNKEQLEQIAQRHSCCKPFGASVTLSVGERDELVAMARRYMALRDADPDGGEPVPMIHECSDWGRWFWMPVQGGSLDKRLDAAMAKEGA